MSAGKVHGRAAVCLLGGYDVSTDTTSVEGDFATAVAKSTGQGGTTDETYVIGVNDNKASVKGLFDDTAAAGLEVAFVALRGTNFVASFMPAGDTQGYPSIGMPTDIPTDAKITSPVAGITTLDANFQHSGAVYFGLVVQPRATATGTGGTQLQSSPLDNAASSANGGEVFFHITALANGTTVSPLTLQHSTDNVTYADLVVCTLAGTAIGATHQTVAASTTVNRYLKVITTATNAHSYTTCVTFKRN